MTWDPQRVQELQALLECEDCTPQEASRIAADIMVRKSLQEMDDFIAALKRDAAWRKGRLS